MINLQTTARLVAIGACVVGAALTLVMLGGADTEATELAALRTATLVALPLGCLAAAVGSLAQTSWARLATFVGLGLCMTFSAISTDSTLSGESGRPLAVLACILAVAGIVLTVATLSPTGE